MECRVCVVLHLDKTNDRFMQLVNKHRLSHDLKGIPKKTQTLYKQVICYTDLKTQRLYK